MSKQLDWLAEEVLATFTELGFNAHYIEDKRHTLADQIGLKSLSGAITWIQSAKQHWLNN